MRSEEKIKVGIEDLTSVVKIMAGFDDYADCGLVAIVGVGGGGTYFVNTKM